MCSKNKSPNCKNLTKTKYLCTCMKNCPPLKRTEIGNVMFIEFISVFTDLFINLNLSKLNVQN